MSAVRYMPCAAVVSGLPNVNDYNGRRKAGMMALDDDGTATINIIIIIIMIIFILVLI
jgi:hypothetical protein